ncbi:MAG: hypothetical protein KGN36_06430, partial [Acidobacteriota bacterium]|nr:hypothetical protein [Acidobacteriota bacterium]
YAIPLALVYGFYPKWSLIAALPYVNVDMTTRTANETRRSNLNGLADLQLLVQYDGLYSRNTPGGLTRLTGVFGIQTPTGASRFSTGAFQYTSGLIFEKVVRLNYVFTSDFEYTVGTENNRGVAVGNSARFDAAPAYFVISRKRAPTSSSWIKKSHDRAFRNGAYLILEFNGNWQARMRNLGDEAANSGGTMLSVSPGLQYFLSRSFLLEFSSPIPVVKALNGVQPEAKVSFVFGFRVLL